MSLPYTLDVVENDEGLQQVIDGEGNVIITLPEGHSVEQILRKEFYSGDYSIDEWQILTTHISYCLRETV